MSFILNNLVFKSFLKQFSHKYTGVRWFSIPREDLGKCFNNFIQYLTCFVFSVVFSISKNKVVVLFFKKKFLIIIPIVPVLCR